MCNFFSKTSVLLVALLFVYGLSSHTTEAATMQLSPTTGVYSVGGTITARVTLNTSGKSVNAAEGTLSFNPRELSVTGVNRTGSIFNLWTQEPTFSNANGTISFGGGSPTGYTGGAGNIMTVTFRTITSGASKVNFTSGSVLAADGLGTNVLTGMTGGTYTANAAAINPEPEYVAPANTPGAPNVTSSTHQDSSGWYAKTTAELRWTLPSGVTSMRTLLDQDSGTIPTIVYDEPVTLKTIEDLPQGVSYFHIQFKNSNGWGKVTHYRLGVDTEKPSAFTIKEAENVDTESPVRTVLFEVEDISPVIRYLIQIDGGEAVEYIDTDATGTYVLPVLSPGRHSLIVEAFDSAGNSLISTYAFDILSFDKPRITEYAERLNTDAIPVIKGITKPNVEVAITISRTSFSSNASKDEGTFTVSSKDDGSFTFVADAPFDIGVFEVTAVATDAYGAKSERSDPAKFIVEEPGYMRIGSFVVSILSVLVPLVGLIVLLTFGMWFLWHRLAVWRRRVLKETREAETMLAREFGALTKQLAAQVAKLKTSRKGKLTKAEDALINEISEDIKLAQMRIHKEISDIDDVVE